MEARRIISPYDLTASDNPGAIISYPLLKTNNYDEWACGMKTTLFSRKKFGFLDGTIPKPAVGSPDLEDWTPINALLVSWIKMSIDQELRSSISHRDVARDLWDHLRKRFSVPSGARNQKMKTDLANCKQNGLSVEEYYGKLTKIWENINAYRPLRVCECGGCQCDLGAQQEKDREDDMVHQFLFGLDEAKFHSVRSSLSSRNPLPSLEEAYNVVRQEENMNINQRMNEEKLESQAFVVQTKPRFKFEDREKSILYKHCRCSGHLSENCFLIVGYPEWWGERSRSRSQAAVQATRGRGKGNVYGGQQRNTTNYANVVSTVSSSSLERVNHVITEKDRDAVSG